MSVGRMKLLALALTISGTAVAGEHVSAPDSDAHRRFDLGLQRVDTPVGDFFTTLVGYTQTFRSDMSFSAGLTATTYRGALKGWADSLRKRPPVSATRC
jgi:hypothetical protein